VNSAMGQIPCSTERISCKIMNLVLPFFVYLQFLNYLYAF